MSATGGLAPEVTTFYRRYFFNITDSISSTLRLFADDCPLYRVIKSEIDTSQLQCDLDYLSQWAQAWQMEFNLSKCTVIKCIRLHSTVSSDYILQDHVLETTTQGKYLDAITLNNTLSWSTHISSTTSRASKFSET